MTLLCIRILIHSLLYKIALSVASLLIPWWCERHLIVDDDVNDLWHLDMGTSLFVFYSHTTNSITSSREEVIKWWLYCIHHYYVLRGKISSGKSIFENLSINVLKNSQRHWTCFFFVIIISIFVLNVLCVCSFAFIACTNVRVRRHWTLDRIGNKQKAFSNNLIWIFFGPRNKILHTPKMENCWKPASAIQLIKLM